MKRLKILTILLLFTLLVTACSRVDSEAGSDRIDTPTGEMAVHFLDVGQGNAVLVENDGLYMLIDGGDREYSSFVVSYLKKLGVDKLTYVIASHYDADHLNGIVGALSVYDVGLILDPDYETDTRVYQSFTELIAKGIDEVHPSIGDTYELGDATFTVVSPANYEYSDGNDASVGVRIQHGKDSFLICGDAGEESEKDILTSNAKLNSTVYMVNHHGSNTSTTESFLDAIEPSYAVISCGVDNSYGHPNQETLDKLEERGIAIFRTDKQGTIIAYSDGNGVTWNVDPTTDYRNGKDTATSEPTDSIGKDTATSEPITSSGKEETNSSTNNNTDSDTTTYIINTNTKKFHRVDCSSVQDMNAENRIDTNQSRKELLGEGYEACGRCKP